MLLHKLTEKWHIVCMSGSSIRQLKTKAISTPNSEGIQELATFSASSMPAVAQYLATIGRKGGIKGGKARAAKLTAERRSEIARLAARSRWTETRK
jgi:hypothetical protein